MLVRIQYTTLLVCILVFQSIAQTPLTLDEALQRGLENNYQVQIAANDLSITQNNNAWGRAGGMPVVTAGINQANRFENAPNFQTDDRKNTFSQSLTPNLNVRWTLFNGFSIRTTKSNLEAYEQMSQQSMNMSMENTIEDITLNYYYVLLQQQRLEVARQLMQLSRDRYEYIQLKKDIGTAVTFDLLQVKNAFLSDSSTFLLQTIAYENALRDLKLSIADTSTTQYLPSDSFEPIIQEYVLSELEQQMMESNYLLQLQQVNQTILQNNISLARSSRYPAFSINAGTDYSTTRQIIDGGDPVGGWGYDFYANLALTYTIFNGGNTNRNIQNAQISSQTGTLELAELQHTYRNILQSLYALYEARKQVYYVATENESSAALNLEIAQDKFNSGAITSFNYRDIQMVYLNISFARLQSIYDLIDIHTKLQKLSGRLLNTQ